MKFMLILLFATFRILETEAKNDYPDIQDLFPTLSPMELEPMKHLDIDIEKIDMDKFKKKLDVFEEQILGNVTSANETRRQAIPYISSSQWNRASNHLLQVKAFDLMLQTIYMSRHKVRQLENEKHFDKTDTAYRIAFLYRKLRRLWRKMLDILTMMRRKISFKYWYLNAEQAMICHQNVIRLHEDFIYLWWVMITVHGKYQSRLGVSTRRIPAYHVKDGPYIITEAPQTSAKF